MDLGWKRLIPLSLGWMLIVAGFLISWRWGLLMFAAVLFAWIVLTRAFNWARPASPGRSVSCPWSASDRSPVRSSAA